MTHTFQLLNYKNPSQNSFIVTNQFVAKSYGADFVKQIPDIVVYINGFPLFVFELKSSRRNFFDSIKQAYKQMTNYQMNLKDLYVFNMFNVISNGNSFQVGALGTQFSWYSSWRHIDKNGAINYEYSPIRSLFKPQRLLKILKNYIHFQDGENLVKIMPAYHQFFGVEKTQDSVIECIQGDDKKAGIFWHTQGSGKSYSMVFLTRNVLNVEKQTTVIVVTDRNDLDEQLHSTFANSSNYLNQKIIQIKSQDDLIKKLKDKSQNGIFFCTIQKFFEEAKSLSDRNDILIITDEAHRSQKNIYLKQILQKDQIIDKKGYGYHLRRAFPNASFIGFTGTPIEKKDHQTKSIFGSYVSKYLMTDATKDKFIVPINYESRIVKLQLSPSKIDALDKVYDECREKIMQKSQLPTTSLKNFNKKVQRIENIICDPDRIKSISEDFVKHYRKRANVLKGKAMFVAYNRKTALSYYKNIISIDPSLKDKMRLIATQNNVVDSEELKNLLKNSAYRKESAIEFKKENSSFKIAIIVDMWLTGFDVPSLDVLYIDKPLKMHNLMQAVARVNRNYEDSTNSTLKKESGLIVDYVGIYKKLIEALKFYTGGKSQIEESVDWKDVKTIYRALKDHLNTIRKKWFSQMNFEIPEIIQTKNKHLIYKKVLLAKKQVYFLKKEVELFINLTKPLSKLLNLSLSEIDEETKVFAQILLHTRNEIIKTELGHLENEKDVEKVMDMMSQTIKYNKTIVQKKFNNKLISLNEVASLVHKKEDLENEQELEYTKKEKINATVELIKRVYEINKIASEKFSKKLQMLLDKYENNIITIAEFFAGLKEIAKDSTNAYEDSKELGLSRIEVSFFEILNSKEYTKNTYDKVKVKEITQKLYDKVKMIIDWHWTYNEYQKSQVRKNLKEILLEENYPPNVSKSVVNEIVGQITNNLHEDIMNSKGEPNV